MGVEKTIMGLRTVMGGVYKHATDIHIHKISYCQWRIYLYMQRISYSGP